MLARLPLDDVMTQDFFGVCTSVESGLSERRGVQIWFAK